MSTLEIPYIDSTAVMRGFNQAAAHYEEASFIEQLLCERLMGRLELFKLKPQNILDVGTSTGRCARALQQYYPKAQVTGVDFATEMLKYAAQNSPDTIDYIAADIYSLPFSDNFFDLILGNATFQLLDDLELAFHNLQKVLAPRGCFIFTTFGPDTLIELREAWLNVNESPRILPFFDMHDIGDALIRAGFVEPLMDREVITITYDNLPKLFSELRNTGLTNYLLDRERGLLGKNIFRQLLAAYQRDPVQNRYTVTLEVVYGLAWKSEVVSQQTVHDNEVHIPVSILTKKAPKG